MKTCSMLIWVINYRDIISNPAKTNESDKQDSPFLFFLAILTLNTYPNILTSSWQNGIPVNKLFIIGEICSYQAEMAPGKKCWGGAKTVTMPTASDSSKIFTDHTFQIDLKCDYRL